MSKTSTHLKDKNGKEIFLNSLVELPVPNETDSYNFSFVGTVIDFRGKNVLVEDQDSDIFEIEAERVEILPD